MMMKYRFGLFSLIVVLLLGGLLLSLFVKKQGATDIGASIHVPGSQLEKQTIVFADNGRAGVAPLYIAKEKNFFGPSIDVEFKQMPNLANQRIGMRAGTVDVYQATYDMYLSTDGAIAPGIAFMLGDESAGADGLLVGSGMETVGDLQEKKVALEVGTPPYLLFQYVASQKGLTLRDFNIKQMSTVDAAAAFLAGEVDAAGLWEPHLSQVLGQMTGTSLLTTSNDYPGLFPSVYFARQELFNSPEFLQDFLIGWVRAMDYIALHEDDAYTIMGDAYDMSADEMRNVTAGIVWHDLESMRLLFQSQATDSVYKKFSVVKDIMQLNGDTPAPNAPFESISSIIVDMTKE